MSISYRQTRGGCRGRRIRNQQLLARLDEIRRRFLGLNDHFRTRKNPGHIPIGVDVDQQ
jgi:hypothetical protein